MLIIKFESQWIKTIVKQLDIQYSMIVQMLYLLIIFLFNIFLFNLNYNNILIFNEY